MNAHIVPFLDDAVAPVSPLYRLQRFLVNDVRARLDYYDKVGGYLPTELANLVAQEYTGKPSDVTIFPTPRLSDLTWRILYMPSRDDVADFILGGMRMSWCHLPRIELQTALERELAAAARALRMPPTATAARGPPLSPYVRASSPPAHEHSMQMDRLALDGGAPAAAWKWSPRLSKAIGASTGTTGGPLSTTLY